MATHLPSAGRRVLLALIAFTVALAMLVVSSVPAEAAGRPLRTGVSYVYRNDPIAFERIRQAGGTLTLTPLTWEHIAPESKPANWSPTDPMDPNYDWAEMDTWVVNAVAAGLTPVLQVRSAPKWAQRCDYIAPDTPCDPDPTALGEFTTAAVKRYSGAIPGLPRVSYWQGLNEPNMNLYFMPQFVDGQAVSAGLYRTLINSFYAAVKAVDPSNVVIAGGLAPVSVPGRAIGPMRFSRELLCMRGHKNPRPSGGNCEGGVYFDVFDVHPYTTGSPAHEGGPNDVQLGDLEKLTTLLRAADKAGRIKNNSKVTPLWITEISWDSKPPDPGGLGAPILRRWTAEALYTAWQAGVSDVFWFTLRDSSPPPPGIPYSENLDAGLYYRGANIAEDKPKPNVQAFRFPFVAYPAEKGLSFWGRTPNSKGGKVVIQVKKGKSWRKVKTVQANKAGIFHAVAKSSYGSNHKGYVRAQYRKERSTPFGMKPVGDFPQPPFGRQLG